MQRVLLKSKIHGATITDKQLHYEGSITLDQDLIEAADLVVGKQVHVLNLQNGERLVTYVIAAPAGSGTIMLNGPAARKGEIGDIVMILSYAGYTESEARAYRPKVIRVDQDNHVREPGSEQR